MCQLILGLSLRIPSSPPTLELSLNGSTAVRHLRCSLATSRRPMQSDMPLPMPAISSVRTHHDLVTVEHSSSANSPINTVRVGIFTSKVQDAPPSPVGVMARRPWGRCCASTSSAKRWPPSGFPPLEPSLSSPPVNSRCESNPCQERFLFGWRHLTSGSARSSTPQHLVTSMTSVLSPTIRSTAITPTSPPLTIAISVCCNLSSIVRQSSLPNGCWSVSFTE